jgi:hypothetical protein
MKDSNARQPLSPHESIVFCLFEADTTGGGATTMSQAGGQPPGWRRKVK